MRTRKKKTGTKRTPAPTTSSRESATILTDEQLLKSLKAGSADAQNGRYTIISSR